MKIDHPVKIGTPTNIGTIASWKYVRFGFGKYRYFTLEGKESYPEEAITEIYTPEYKFDDSITDEKLTDMFIKEIREYGR